MSISKITCKFERFLFDGVHEHPEPIWERDENTHYRVRHTGKSYDSTDDITSQSKSDVLGYFTYDFNTKDESFTFSDK